MNVQRQRNTAVSILTENDVSIEKARHESTGTADVSKENFDRCKSIFLLVVPIQPHHTYTDHNVIADFSTTHDCTFEKADLFETENDGVVYALDDRSQRVCDLSSKEY